jgi:HlyD family secretion protein
MNKTLKIILIVIPVLILAAGLAAVGLSGLGVRQVEAAGHQQAPDATAAAAVPSAADNWLVIAEGKVLPSDHATLSMAAGGIVAELLAHEGDALQAGQAIVRLRDEQQRAAVAQAEAALASAQANLDALTAGARPEELAVVQAGLDGAQASLARLTGPARAEDIVAARAALAAAQASLNRLYEGPSKNTRIAAEADLSNAEAALRVAQAAYDPVAGRPDVGMLPQSLQLEQATNSYQAAKARYDQLFAAPEADQVQQARAQVKQAQANLDRLLNPATSGERAESEAAVRRARAQLDLLTAGATAEQIAAAQAAVDQAAATLQQAQASLDDTVLRAPFAGTLAALHVSPGEPVMPAAPVAELGDLSRWQVETDDLTELDVVGVEVGQTVDVTFDAIPDLTLQGTVLRIQPLGVEKVGDVTYTVVVRPEQQDPRLRWGMTAVVTIP